MIQDPLTDIVLSRLIISILIKRLGGTVSIGQSDIDDIAFGQLNEVISASDGSIRLYLTRHERCALS